MKDTVVGNMCGSRNERQVADDSFSNTADV